MFHSIFLLHPSILIQIPVNEAVGRPDFVNTMELIELYALTHHEPAAPACHVLISNKLPSSYGSDHSYFFNSKFRYLLIVFDRDFGHSLLLINFFNSEIIYLFTNCVLFGDILIFFFYSEISYYQSLCIYLFSFFAY